MVKARRRPRRPKTTKDAYLHAARRAAARYGVTLSISDYNHLVKQIQSSEAQFIARQSSTRSIFLVEHAGVAMKAVYQPGIGILTVLAPDMVTRVEAELAARLEESGGTK